MKSCRLYGVDSIMVNQRTLQPNHMPGIRKGHVVFLSSGQAFAAILQIIYFLEKITISLKFLNCFSISGF